MKLDKIQLVHNCVAKMASSLRYNRTLAAPLCTCRTSIAAFTPPC